MSENCEKKVHVKVAPSMGITFRYSTSIKNERRWDENWMGRRLLCKLGISFRILSLSSGCTCLRCEQVVCYRSVSDINVESTKSITWFLASGRQQLITDAVASDNVDLVADHHFMDLFILLATTFLAARCDIVVGSFWRWTILPMEMTSGVTGAGECRCSNLEPCHFSFLPVDLTSALLALELNEDKLKGPK